MSIHVSFMKRVTTGPYEHEEMNVQFSVEKKQELETETQEYKNFVYRTLGKSLPSTSTTTPAPTQETSKGEKDAKQKDSQEAKGSKKSDQKASAEKSGKEKSSEKEVAASTSTTEEMEEVESPFTDSKESTPTKETKKAAKKDEGIPYDSEKGEHKSTLSNFLTKLTGGKEWAKDKVRSQKVSKEILHGQPFLGKDGGILPSFETLCKENFGNTADVL